MSGWCSLGWHHWGTWGNVREVRSRMGVDPYDYDDGPEVIVYRDRSCTKCGKIQRSLGPTI